MFTFKKFDNKNGYTICIVDNCSGGGGGGAGTTGGTGGRGGAGVIIITCYEWK